MPNEYLKQIEWKQSPELVAYADALAFMEVRVEGIVAGREPPCVWFLQHPPLYTAGTSANATDMLDKERFPIFEAGRGGEYTYHGPGQLVVYCMLDLKQLFAPNPPDLRAYIKWLEGWIISTLAEFGIKGFIKEGMIGVWVDETSGFGIQDSVKVELNPESRILNPSEAKIAAIGVRVRKWVSFHGLCINVAPDLSHYAGIVPCGIKEYGVTSLERLGVAVNVEQLAIRLKAQCHI